MQEALNSGAKGYVVKANAGSELLPAIAAVLQGEKFLSKGLSGRFSTDVAENRVPDPIGYPAHSAPLASRIRHSPRGHAVQFYADDASLVVGFTSFIETALETGNAVAVIATENHQQTILQRLEADGVDVVGAIDERRYIPLDVDETLSTFMVNDKPDPVRFQKAVGDLFAAAKGKKARIDASQPVVKQHRLHGQRAKQKLRFRSNTSGTRCPGYTTWIPCVGMF